MTKVSVGAKTLLYPTPVVLVGTYDAAGAPNIMVAAWAGICCSRPPCVAVSLRAATYSHGAIVARQIAAGLTGKAFPALLPESVCHVVSSVEPPSISTAANPETSPKKAWITAKSPRLLMMLRIEC